MCFFAKNNIKNVEKSSFYKNNLYFCVGFITVLIEFFNKTIL